MGLGGALRRAARDRALSELCRRQVRPASRHPVQQPGRRRALPGRTRAAGTSCWRMAGVTRRAFWSPPSACCPRPTMPRIPGVETFRGQSCHTHYWPKEPVRFEGKRVAVIGTGATGIQTITEVAKTAGHLTVFQRTPQWSAPLHNARIGEEEMRRIRANYAEIFARCQETFGCFIHVTDPRAALEVTQAGARGLLGEALRRARLRHLDGQFPRHPGRTVGRMR